MDNPDTVRNIVFTGSISIGGRFCPCIDTRMIKLTSALIQNYLRPAGDPGRVPLYLQFKSIAMIHVCLLSVVLFHAVFIKLVFKLRAGLSPVAGE